MISAIVLAAGLSQRMGAFKQLLPYGERSVIETIVNVLRGCPVDEILVVLGHRHREVGSVLKQHKVRTTFNPRYQDGMLTSIQHGWRECSSAATWILQALGDQPHLEPPVVEKLAALAKKENAGIFVPAFGNRRGHPILIHSSYREEILALGEGSILRDFMRAHASEIRHVPVETDSILRDMDTREDYERELALRGSGLIMPR